MFARGMIETAFILGCLLLTGCGSGENEDLSRKTSSPYFPLKKGDAWTYETEGRERSMKVKVVGFEKIADEWFAHIERTDSVAGNERGRFSEYWTAGDSGRVVALLTYYSGPKSGTKPTAAEIQQWRSVYYQTSVPIGTTWFAASETAYWPKGTQQIQLELAGRYDSLVVAGRVFYDCLEFKVRQNMVEWSDFLARGIGLICQRTEEGTYSFKGADPK